MTTEALIGALVFMVLVFLLALFWLALDATRDEDEHYQEWKREREIMTGKDAEKEARL